MLLPQPQNLILECDQQNKKLSILILDDDFDDRLQYEYMIEQSQNPWKVCQATNIREATILCEKNNFHCILLDHHLQGETGLDGISSLLESQPELAIVVLTGNDDPLLAQKFLSRGAAGYLPKNDISGLTLTRSIQYAVQNRAIIRTYSEMYKQMLRAYEVKNSFLAALSHELRTPLSAIIGYSGCMIEGLVGHLEEKQKKILEKITLSGKLLTASIEDLLFVAESNLIDFQLGPLKPVSLYDQCNDLLYFYSSTLKDKEITVKIFKEKGDVLIQANPDSLKRALRQILDNAIRFSQRKEIKIYIQPRDYLGEIFICDQGPGISIERLSSLYSMDVDFPNAEQKVRSGRGLGLPLTKAIIDKHKGHLMFCTSPGLGTTCRLSIPIYRT